MLEVEDHVTLMDFGIAQARATSRLTRAGIAVGTLEYLAPERARGEASTPQTDIYSLGVLAFELLTGHLPYQAADDRALLQQHLAAPIPPLRRQRPDIPPSVETAVQRCLAKHPQERFLTASEFVHALTDSTSNARRSTAPLPRAESVSPPVTRPLNTSPSPIPAVPSPTHPRLSKRHHTWKFPWWTLGIIAALTIITLGTQIAPSVARNLQLPRLAVNTTSYATNPSPVPTATPHSLALPTPTPHPQPTPTPTPIPIPVIHPTTYGAAIQGFYNALLTAISTRNQADWMRAYAYLSPAAQKHQSLTAFEQQYAADHSIAWRWNPGTVDSPTEVSVPTHLTEYRTGGNLSSNFDWVIINNQQGWHLDHTIPLPTHPLLPGPTTHGQERN